MPILGAFLVIRRGFINITQNTQRVVFVGTFCAGHLEAQVIAGQLVVACEAGVKKFVTAVEQVTFNGSDAQRRRQSVLYVTERCVFRLTDSGLELIEIAPGIDLERDIVALMNFRPSISPLLKPMDPRIFGEAPMQLRHDLLQAHSAYNTHPQDKLLP